MYRKLEYREVIEKGDILITYVDADTSVVGEIAGTSKYLMILRNIPEKDIKTISLLKQILPVLEYCLMFIEGVHKIKKAMSMSFEHPSNTLDEISNQSSLHYNLNRCIEQIKEKLAYE